MIDVTPQPWMARAACTTADPELFFPPERSRGEDRLRRETEAKAICAGCDVRAECLAFILATEGASSRHGVWGGLTEDERSGIERKRKRIPHGTRNGYERHLRIGEVACVPCKDAHNTYQREKARERAERRSS